MARPERNSDLSFVTAGSSADDRPARRQTEPMLRATGHPAFHRTPSWQENWPPARETAPSTSLYYTTDSGRETSVTDADSDHQTALESAAGDDEEETTFRHEVTDEPASYAPTPGHDLTDSHDISMSQVPTIQSTTDTTPSLQPRSSTTSYSRRAASQGPRSWLSESQDPRSMISEPHDSRPTSDTSISIPVFHRLTVDEADSVHETTSESQPGSPTQPTAPRLKETISSYPSMTSHSPASSDAPLPPEKDYTTVNDTVRAPASRNAAAGPMRSLTANSTALPFLTQTPRSRRETGGTIRAPVAQASRLPTAQQAFRADPSDHPPSSPVAPTTRRQFAPSGEETAEGIGSQLPLASGSDLHRRSSSTARESVPSNLGAKPNGKAAINPRIPSTIESAPRTSMANRQSAAAASEVPTRPPLRPADTDLVQSKYVNMLLALDAVPRLHNLLASFFTWILLAGFVVLPGTFSSLEQIQTASGPVGRVVNAIQHVSLFVIAYTCCVIGAGGMGWLWWRWRGNYIWLLNKIFVPGAMNGLAGVLSTIASVFGAQHGHFTASSITTMSVTGGTTVVCGSLAAFYNFWRLERVKRQHEQEVGIQTAGKHGEGWLETAKQAARQPQPPERGLF